MGSPRRTAKAVTRSPTATIVPAKSLPSVIGNRDAPINDSSRRPYPPARRTSIGLTEAASTATSISSGAGLRRGTSRISKSPPGGRGTSRQSVSACSHFPASVGLFQRSHSWPWSRCNSWNVRELEAAAISGGQSRDASLRRTRPWRKPAQSPLRLTRRHSTRKTPLGLTPQSPPT